MWGLKGMPSRSTSFSSAYTHNRNGKPEKKNIKLAYTMQRNVLETNQPTYRRTWRRVYMLYRQNPWRDEVVVKEKRTWWSSRCPSSRLLWNGIQGQWLGWAAAGVCAVRVPRPRCRRLCEKDGATRHAPPGPKPWAGRPGAPAENLLVRLCNPTACAPPDHCLPCRSSPRWTVEMPLWM